MDAGWLALSLGLAGLGGPPESAGAAGSAWVAARVAGPAWIELGVHQGALAGPARVFTGIHADGRLALGEHAFLRGGFVHQHETDWPDFRDEVVGVSLGASDHIHHRTGAEAGAGYRFGLPAFRSFPLHLSLSGSAIAFPDDGGPHLYGVVESTVSVTLGKKASAEDE